MPALSIAPATSTVALLAALRLMNGAVLRLWTAPDLLTDLLCQQHRCAAWTLQFVRAL